MKYNTRDNYTYYQREHSNKPNQIFDFVSKHSDIKKVFDAGCNNGKMSYRLQKELGKEVYGVDLSENLTLPDDYNFEVVDLVKSQKVYLSDLTLYLSLYHHMLGAYNIETADDLFFKLLLSSNYLIFDAGNLTEKHRTDQPWYTAQLEFFKDDKELYDHFNIDYNIIGRWDLAGGKRDLLVFDSSSFDKNVIVLEQYRRLAWAGNQYKGLIPLSDVKVPQEIEKNYVDENLIYHGALFSKLQIANKIFFAKKHTIHNYEEEEKENIIEVYGTLGADKLIKFYGFSEKYGFIYEWVDDFIYRGKTSIALKDKVLKDVDKLEINGKIKYTDFHS